MIHKVSVDSLVTEMQPLDTQGPEAALLLDAVRKILPAIQRTDMESIRTIVRPIPGDNLTCSGWVPGVDGYYVAVTHSGVSIAPHLGKAVAQEVVRGRLHESLTDFRPDRFLAAKNGMGQRA
jgi:glycine/D-amino acid oxidase-like deaminating enzyme